MNTATAQSSAGNAPAQNIGFAIPINRVKSLLPQLRRGGTVSPPKAYMGVAVVSDNSSLQQQYGLAGSRGAVVVNVVGGSPAATAGIQPGDVITGIAGMPVTSSNSLVSDLAKLKPGNTVKVVVKRSSQQGALTLTITLGTAPTTTGTFG
jgi:S1-C subfamily serine protease